MVTVWPASSIILVISRSLSPTTFWPSTSNKLCSIRSPFLAADDSTTMATILPCLNWNPTWPVESFCNVKVLSKGLEKDLISTKFKRRNGLIYLSRTAKTMLLTPAFLNKVWTFSAVYPAIVSLLICRIWSPNFIPPKAAGLPLETKDTKMPLSIDWTLKPTFPSLSLHSTT